MCVINVSRSHSAAEYFSQKSSKSSYFLTKVGLTKIIHSDQGSNFMSRLIQQVVKQLGITSIKANAYHPQSQGALERFHFNLKNMRIYCLHNQKEWDESIPFLMFAACESVQESLGFSPFELIFGNSVRGPLQLIKEKWLRGARSREHLLDYVERFGIRISEINMLAREHLRSVQGKMIGKQRSENSR